LNGPGAFIKRSCPSYIRVHAYPHIVSMHCGQGKEVTSFVTSRGHVTSRTRTSCNYVNHDENIKLDAIVSHGRMSLPSSIAVVALHHGRTATSRCVVTRMINHDDVHFRIQTARDPRVSSSAFALIYGTVTNKHHLRSGRLGGNQCTFRHGHRRAVPIQFARGLTSSTSRRVHT